MRWMKIEDLGAMHSWSLKDKEPLAELKLSLTTNTMRLSSTDKRLFFLESSGLLQQKVTIQSEYGISFGELQYTKLSNSGFMLLNQYKYHYELTTAGVTLYNYSKQLINNCDIDDVNNLGILEFSSLVFGWVWIVQAARQSELLATNNFNSKR